MTADHLLDICAKPTHLFAQGNIIPKMNSPRRGPPIIPNRDNAACNDKVERSLEYKDVKA
jgi:hypothetical protein